MAQTGIRTKEVSWKVMDIEISGTVAYPSDSLSHPGIVLVAGSGPTDRNWCSPLLPGNNGSGKLLAEELAKAGYVTLRYDKMASGPRVKDNIGRFSGKLSMDTHRDELAGAIDSLASQENVLTDRLFAITNSEGAIHAINYQLSGKNPKLNGFIFTGAPGRSVGDVARDQLEKQLTGYPGGDKLLEIYDREVGRFLHGDPMTVEDSLPDGLKLMLRALETPSNLPFSRELWTYSVSEHIGKISEPILVIIGRKDIQVNWKEDGSILEKALSGNVNATISYPEDGNHILKHEEKPLEELTPEYVSMQYNADGVELDIEAVRIIKEWLEKWR